MKPTEKQAETTPDLEGVRNVSEDVGELPVPRSVLESKGRNPPEDAGSPYDRERGLLPGARRPVGPPPRERVAAPGPAAIGREEEAGLRRSLPRAAITPEQLGKAMSRGGAVGIRDPQEGREAGPPFPGERGMEGDQEP